MDLNSFFYPNIHLKDFLKKTGDKLWNQPTYTASKQSSIAGGYKPSPKASPTGTMGDSGKW